MDSCNSSESSRKLRSLGRVPYRDNRPYAERKKGTAAVPAPQETSQNPPAVRDLQEEEKEKQRQLLLKERAEALKLRLAWEDRELLEELMDENQKLNEKLADATLELRAVKILEPEEVEEMREHQKYLESVIDKKDARIKKLTDLKKRQDEYDNECDKRIDSIVESLARLSQKRRQRICAEHIINELLRIANQTLGVDLQVEGSINTANVLSQKQEEQIALGLPYLIDQLEALSQIVMRQNKTGKNFVDQWNQIAGQEMVTVLYKAAMTIKAEGSLQELSTSSV